jgi:dethiobiotin synthetase
MAKGFFVTATDTSTGKTIISAALIRAMRYMGHKAAAMKPIETGCVKRDNVLLPSDGIFLKNVSGMDENINTITPCTYEKPLSPLAASKIEDKEVDLPGIMQAYNDLSGRYDVIIVEGIGGLSVPISRDYFVSDLAMEMELPLIIVVRPTLGTINHTLLTIHYAVTKGLDIAGIIINYSSEPENDIAEETNKKTLKSVTEVPIIGTFPYLNDFEEETLDREIIKSFDMSILEKHLM